MNRPLALLWTGSFAFYLSFYLLLSVLPLYARAAGVTDQAIGLIIGCFAFASMLVKPWAGWGSDRFGRKPLLLLGSVIFLAASLAYGVSGSALALLLVRLLHGSGMGLYPTAASAAVADLAPPARRGELLGVLGAAANVAMALGPLAGMEVATRLGFRGLFTISAVIAALAVAVSVLVPETLAQRRRLRLRLDAALSADALRPSLIVLCMMVSYGAQVSFLPIHADRLGINPGLFFLAFATVVALVRGQAGRLSDRIGRAPVTIAGLLLAAAALVTLALSASLAGLVTAGALYGVGFGSAQPTLMAWCVDLVGTHDRGRAMGTYYTALELGIAVGAAATGLAVSLAGFTWTFLGVAVVVLTGAGLALTSRRQAAVIA